MKKYFYVYNRSCNKPTRRHEDKDSAIKEAIRLSKLMKKNFYVLEPSAHVIYDHDTSEVLIEDKHQ